MMMTVQVNDDDAKQGNHRAITSLKFAVDPQHSKYFCFQYLLRNLHPEKPIPPFPVIGENWPTQSRSHCYRRKKSQQKIR